MHADSAPTSTPLDRPLDVTTLSHEEYEILCDKAVRIIQRTWRRHVDIRVFTYFKGLIQFHNQGDPRILLKHVNPREADILDSAAGVFVRFRLGGVTFPPNIYYKIFTHRPIVDMCANSPKDYTHEAQRHPVPRQLHNFHSAVSDDRSGWYKRVENNGWRVLAGKIGYYGDAITQHTTAKKLEHRHTKLLRRQDVEKRRKMRKIEWFKKMYEEGILCARTDDKQTALLVEKSTFGMMFAVDQLGVDSIAEWEVDELLEWTNALNFDEYINEWKAVGTSQSTDCLKDRRQEPSSHITSEYSKLTQNDSQYVTNSSTLYPQISNQIKSEHSSDPAPLYIPDGSSCF